MSIRETGPAALPTSQREVRRRAAQADAHAAEAMQQHRLGMLTEAEVLYRQALSLQPDHADSLHGMGVLARISGRSDLAIAFIGRAVAARPEVAHYYIDLGHALGEQGHSEEARAALQVAVLREPEDPRAHVALATALERLGRPDEAIASLHTATTLAPDDASSWHQLGAMLGRHGRLAEAEVAFRRTVALVPEDAGALANLGGLLFERNQHTEAGELLRLAVEKAPPSPATLSNLGLVLMAQGELVEAERHLGRAAELAPAEDAILVNRGSVLTDLGRYDEAETCFRTVEARAPSGSDNAARARFNRATVLMAKADLREPGPAGTARLREGWELFESRRSLLSAAAPPSARHLPEWDGHDLTGASAVLLHAEQGLGDAIQFLRYVPLAARHGPVVLALPAPLLRLATGLAGPNCVVVPVDDPRVGTCVARASLLSLPHLLHQPSPPPFAPYLEAPDEPGWPQFAGSLSGLKVGLSWAGSPSYRFDRRRSMRLADLAPLAGVAGISLVSLQQGEAAQETPPDGLQLLTPPTPPGDLADTAGLIARLDLVVSVDTAIAHLAGALGRPVWLLNRFGGDWRWQDGGTGPDGRSLWYPSLRQFRQAAPLPPDRAWLAPVAALASALADLSAAAR